MRRDRRNGHDDDGESYDDALDFFGEHERDIRRYADMPGLAEGPSIIGLLTVSGPGSLAVHFRFTICDTARRWHFRHPSDKRRPRLFASQALVLRCAFGGALWRRADRPRQMGAGATGSSIAIVSNLGGASSAVRFERERFVLPP